jgi:hypothetical protein
MKNLTTEALSVLIILKLIEMILHLEIYTQVNNNWQCDISDILLALLKIIIYIIPILLATSNAS